MGLQRGLLISGSLREGSTNTAVLRTVRAVAPRGVELTLYEGLSSLPHFNPDVEATHPLPMPVVELRATLAAADAVLFCTPEYAGALPGSLKNLLDWCVGEGLYGKRAGYLNVAAPLGRAEGAHAELRTVLGYVTAELIPEACLSLPVRRDQIGDDGLVHDPSILEALTAAVQALWGPARSSPPPM